MSLAEANASNSHCHQWNDVIADTSKVFGGHPAPKLGVPYEVTLREKKDAYHSICMMKVLSDGEVHNSCPHDEGTV